MAKRNVDIYINGHDRASKAFGGIQKVIGGFGLFMAGRAVKGAIVDVANESIEFRHQMALVNTMLDDSSFMDNYSENIMRMSGAFGQSKETLTTGLYDILSAGIDAAGAIDVLAVATRGAIGGNTDTATSVDGLTTVINAFSASAQDSAHIMDLMFNTVKEGKITFPELAENISKLAPLAHAAGMSMEEMFASVATAVKVEKPERAMTAISQAMIKATEQGKSLSQVISELQGTDLKTIMDAGFDKRAAQGIALLAGNYEEYIEQIEKAANAQGKADDAFNKMANTKKNDLAEMKESWNALKTQIGDNITEVEYFQDIIENFGLLFRNFGEFGMIAFNELKLGALQWYNVMAGVYADIWHSATVTLPKAFMYIYDNWSTIWDNIKSFTENILTNIMANVFQVFDRLGNTKEGMFTALGHLTMGEFEKAGKAMATAMKDGFKDFEWIDITDGLKFKELPNLHFEERQVSAIEKALMSMIGATEEEIRNLWKVIEDNEQKVLDLKNKGGSNGGDRPGGAPGGTPGGSTVFPTAALSVTSQRGLSGLGSAIRPMEENVKQVKQTNSILEQIQAGLADLPNLINDSLKNAFPDLGTLEV